MARGRAGFRRSAWAIGVWLMITAPASAGVAEQGCIGASLRHCLAYWRSIATVYGSDAAILAAMRPLLVENDDEFMVHKIGLVYAASPMAGLLEYRIIVGHGESVRSISPTLNRSWHSLSSFDDVAHSGLLDAAALAWGKACADTQGRAFGETAIRTIVPSLRPGALQIESPPNEEPYILHPEDSPAHILCGDLRIVTTQREMWRTSTAGRSTSLSGYSMATLTKLSTNQLLDAGPGGSSAGAPATAAPLPPSPSVLNPPPAPKARAKSVTENPAKAKRPAIEDSDVSLGVALIDLTALGQARPGAAVVKVEADSVAKAAGIHSGDTIIAYQGTAIADSAALLAAIRHTQPGQRVTIDILRGGARRTVEAEF